jgi:hypothetical protein
MHFEEGVGKEAALVVVAPKPVVEGVEDREQSLGRSSGASLEFAL